MLVTRDSLASLCSVAICTHCKSNASARKKTGTHLRHDRIAKPPRQPLMPGVAEPIIAGSIVRMRRLRHGDVRGPHHAAAAPSKSPGGAAAGALCSQSPDAR